MHFPWRIWKSAVIGLRFLPLEAADVCEAGTHDDPLRKSGWEAGSDPAIPYDRVFPVYETNKVALPKQTREEEVTHARLD